MVYITKIEKAQLVFGKKFIYKKKIENLYNILKQVNLTSGLPEQPTVYLKDIEQFLCTIFTFGLRNKHWASHRYLFCTLDNGIVELLHRLQYCLMHLHTTQTSKNAGPFKCCVSAPVQYKWYSNNADLIEKVADCLDELGVKLEFLRENEADFNILKNMSTCSKEYCADMKEAYQANLLWLYQEISQGCRWYSKESFDKQMKLEWVPHDD